MTPGRLSRPRGVLEATRLEGGELFHQMFESFRLLVHHFFLSGGIGASGGA